MKSLLSTVRALSLALGATLALGSVSTPASAVDICSSTVDCTLDLTVRNQTLLGAGPFGTVRLALSGGIITVTIDLIAGFGVIDTGFPGGVGFNDSLAGLVEISGFKEGATVGTLATTDRYRGYSSSNSTVQFDGFGDFNNAAATTYCANGWNSAENKCNPGGGNTTGANVLQFLVNVAGGGSFTDVEQLVLGSTGFGTPPGGALFVVDVYGNGYTGLVGATGSCALVDCGGERVPEPGTLALLGLAMAGLGFVRRRRAD